MARGKDRANSAERVVAVDILGGCVGSLTEKNMEGSGDFRLVPLPISYFSNQVRLIPVICLISRSQFLYLVIIVQ